MTIHPSYPIRPSHINTKELPKGFALLLPYRDQVILWALIQYWQYLERWHHKVWNTVTLSDFMIWSRRHPSHVNKAFNRLKNIELNEIGKVLIVGDEDDRTLAPTHFFLSTLFMHNPAQ